MKLITPFTQLTQINSRVIKVLCLKHKPLNILVEGIGEYLLDLELEKEDLNQNKSMDHKR